MFDLTAIQAAIRAQGLNGWLLADFRWVAPVAVFGYRGGEARRGLMEMNLSSPRPLVLSAHR